MDTKTVIELVDELQENLQDLEDNLEPILSGALSATTKKLPLLDRAKLNVLLVYSIESLIFSYLRLHGVQAKEHPVFKELTRVKQYFEKIKQSEATPQSSRPTLSLDKDAAGRFIKHALAGNEKYDLQRAEREAREKVLANQKLKALESAMKIKAEANTNAGRNSDATDAPAQAAQLTSVSLDEPSSSEGLADSDFDRDGDEENPSQQPQTHQGKKRKNKSRSKSQRAKRKRESEPQDPGNEDQARKTAGNKTAKKSMKKAKQVQNVASTAG